MTEQMERLSIDEIIAHCERKTERIEKYNNGANTIESASIDLPIVKEYWEHRQVAEYLKEIQQYRAIGTVETIITRLAMLEKYKSIDTIENLQALKEKLENAKEDIRKLLCSEYGDSCQFCIHDENEDAMCCNIGGSGSWCCENARWKER